MLTLSMSSNLFFRMDKEALAFLKTNPSSLPNKFSQTNYVA